MNKKYFVAALALAGIVIVSPVFAGSTSVGGGTKTQSNLKVVEHIGTGNNTTIVSGSASRTLHSTGAVTSTSFGTTVINSANPSAVDKAIKEYTESGRNYIIAGRSSYNAAHNAAKMAGIHINGTEVTSSSTTSKVFERETFTRTETRSTDCIFVGDVDDFSAAYVAQGTYDRQDVNDKYYHYDNTTVYQVNTTGTISPIILDLDGDGKIQASNGNYLPHEGDFTKNAVMFDFNGNGFPIACEWVGSNDGLLCRPNEDGSVIGTNLFGTANGYDNGYDEMATLDEDGNGALEGAELEGLMVWTDNNSNGIADADELQSLEQLGITSIGVNHRDMVGSFVRNGKTFKSFDWWPSVVDCRKVNVALR